MTNGTNGWNEWAKHVLETLKDLKGQQKELTEKVDELKVEVALLKQQMAIRSIAWASIPSAIAIIVAVLLKYL